MHSKTVNLPSEHLATDSFNTISDAIASATWTLSLLLLPALVLRSLQQLSFLLTALLQVLILASCLNLSWVIPKMFVCVHSNRTVVRLYINSHTLVSRSHIDTSKNV